MKTIFIILIVLNIIPQKCESFLNQDVSSIQTSLLIVSSIFVPILISYISMRYLEVRKIRLKKLEEYIEYQKELKYFLKCFNYLEKCLRSNPFIHIENLSEKSYMDLFNDREFRNNPANYPFFQMFFKTSLFLANKYNENYCENIDELLQEVVDSKSRKIRLSKKEILEIFDCTQHLKNHMLETDFLKELFDELHVNYDEDSTSHDVNIILPHIFFNRQIEVSYYIDESISSRIDEDPDNLLFWEKLNDLLLDLIEKMKLLYPFLDDYKPSFYSQIMSIVFVITISGIISPLLLISFQLGLDIELAITLFLVFIVIAGIIYVIWKLYQDFTVKSIPFF